MKIIISKTIINDSNNYCRFIARHVLSVLTSSSCCRLCHSNKIIIINNNKQLARNNKPQNLRSRCLTDETRVFDFNNWYKFFRIIEWLVAIRWQVTFLFLAIFSGTTYNGTTRRGNRRRREWLIIQRWLWTTRKLCNSTMRLTRIGTSSMGFIRTSESLPKQNKKKSQLNQQFITLQILQRQTLAVHRVSRISCGQDKR